MQRAALFARQGWYPLDEHSTRQSLVDYLQSDERESPAVAVISPHAGWVYSGPTAGKLYAQVEIPERVVVLCPMHQAGGPAIAVWPDGSWETPLGEVAVDAEFARALFAAHPTAKPDYDSHRYEHAIEIQVPFLKMRNPAVKIVPIRLGPLTVSEAQALGQSLAGLIENTAGDTLIVASSDMSHEPDPARVERNDLLARKPIAALDAKGLIDTVRANNITMCGYIPAAVALFAANALGAKTSREVAYTDSAKISGRTDYVVGYLAARFDR